MRRWWVGGAGSVLVGLTAALLVLVTTSGPVRSGGVQPLVRVETWPPTAQSAAQPLAEPKRSRLPDPSDWAQLPDPPPLGPVTEAVPMALAAPATTPAQAVANAYAEGVAPGRFSRVAVALYDRDTATFYGAGDTETGYRAASVVKVFIAARLLHAGPANGGSLTSGDWSDLWKMITCSDNDAADRLWARGGYYQGVIYWVQSTYGVTWISASEHPNSWGTTWITARGMVQFYNAMVNDPAVAPWLIDAMANANPNCGGQFWGLPVAAHQWAVKQGWVCCWSNPAEPQTRLHSTGYVGGGNRFIAVLLTEGPQSLYSGPGRSYVTAMAQALLPGGEVPVPPVVSVPHERPTAGQAVPSAPPVRAPATPVAPPPGRPASTDGPAMPGLPASSTPGPS